VALVLVMLLAIRYTKTDVFQTTPTDILVIVLVGGVGLLYERGIVATELAPMVVELVLLFYAAELAMRQMKTPWNFFTLGLLGGLALLSLRIVA
jgi:hypothetical protein